MTLVAFAGVATAASATTIEYTSGGTVASGSAISGSLKSGTVAHLEGGSAGDIDCSASAFGGTLGTNPFTPSVTGSLTSLTFSSCTDTIPFVTVSSVTTNVGTGVNAKTATATWVAPGTNSTFAIAGVEVTVTFSSGSTCIYQPTGATATAKHNSNTTPKNNEYHFDDVPVTKIGGTFGFCPTNGVTWDALYVATSGGTGITIQD
ncbi:MAG TPA: hypothetical protein VHF89_11485 [Solirubrobacteraceae bacterium]|nr:hypothetical protein [Solirubrobacteraceae bacterium]